MAAGPVSVENMAALLSLSPMNGLSCLAQWKATCVFTRAMSTLNVSAICLCSYKVPPLRSYFGIKDSCVIVLCHHDV